MIPPSSDEALIGQQRLAVEQLTEIVEKNELSDYTQLAAEYACRNMKRQTSLQLLFRTLTREPNDTPVTISEERPLPTRRGSSSRSGGGGYKGNRSGGRRMEAVAVDAATEAAVHVVVVAAVATARQDETAAAVRRQSFTLQQNREIITFRKKPGAYYASGFFLFKFGVLCAFVPDIAYTWKNETFLWLNRIE